MINFSITIARGRRGLGPLRSWVSCWLHIVIVVALGALRLPHRFHHDPQYHARRVILEKVKPSTAECNAVGDRRP